MNLSKSQSEKKIILFMLHDIDYQPFTCKSHEKIFFQRNNNTSSNSNTCTCSVESFHWYDTILCYFIYRCLSMTKPTITFTQYKFCLFSTDSLIYLVTLTQKGLQYLVSRKSEPVENILKTCVQVCYL